MNTIFALGLQYGKAVIDLKDVCDDVFGVKIKTAEQQIKALTFPIVTFKLRDSERCPTQIHIEDLANYIDECRTKAQEEWQSVRT